ncbi:MAG: hypothetical protein ACI8T6_000082 [Candidatus Poseidoniaceae archaeon]|jgi:hypothetical protein|tara:strand:+ start:299 stop:799 length:501 start_codon:yes stop_codon:yes gene_type:complete
MDTARNRDTMSTWETVHLETETRDDVSGESMDARTLGLEAEPQQLHAEFHVQAGHLSEAQLNHQRVLVASGMIPESHLAEIEPERRLAWMVDQLHGTVNPDGLTIPLHGADNTDIEISTLHDETQRQLRIVVKEAGHDDLLRILPVPAEAGEIRAHFINGRLHLRW